MGGITRNVRNEPFQFYHRECRLPTVDELAKASSLPSPEISLILQKLGVIITLCSISTSYARRP
ncbi:hypothetical protein N7532_002367 [Penicillium argentinense]|uniref:Uncharacterized protein n=1 Tax=Penicillium argentinense TaxID=1131581 RepID=A0A9W9G0D7_9EURO|nr:uncharacterized protein N7532_002367 [Penicillium argentinense]KAJ5109722.1 hypothetical protein N7532_002367 [Penicillium argentinense]